MLRKADKNNRRKLYNIWSFYKDFNYYDYSSFKVKLKDNSLLRGTIYALDEYKLDMEKLEYIEKNFDNTKVYKSYCQYAPEIKKVWLFIAR